ncbi:MAG: hypothetical protein ACRDVE_09660 [Actinocrinis sp.]
MSPSDSSVSKPSRDRNPLVFWATPATAALGGVAYLATLAAGGHPAAGVAALVIMLVAAGALVLAARYSETIRGLMDRRDERIAGIDLKATALTGVILIVAVLIGALVEFARGHSGAPYTWLAAIAGLAYIVSIALLRARR